jgi:hypothetical protein
MSDVVASRPVPRPTKRLKKGEQHQVHLMLPADMLQLIDQAAMEIGREVNPWAPPVTRTEAIKTLLTEGLKKRGLLK